MQPQDIKQWLRDNAEEKYRKFTAALIPNVDINYGIRLPKLRSFAQKIAKNDWQKFLAIADDDSYEEVLLQGLVIAYAKTTSTQKQKILEAFILKINNWGVCDSVCATIKDADENQEIWWQWLQPYIISDKEYEARFGVVMLLFHFINADYLPKILKTINRPHYPNYYAQMAVGWLIAETYGKFPKETEALLRKNQLEAETQNKAIRKICESLRTNKQEKEKIKLLKK